MFERGVSGWVWGGKTAGVSVRGMALPSTGLPSALSSEGGRAEMEGDKGHLKVNEGSQNHMYSRLTP